MAKLKTVESGVRWSDRSDSTDHPFFQEKFTVKDIMRMFNLSLRPPNVKSDDKTDQRLQDILQMVRDEDFSDMAASYTEVKTEPHRSCEILAIPSDSSTLMGTFAASETPLKEKEVLVHPLVRDAYWRMLQNRVIPNSTFKKLPKPLPPPPPTYDENMHAEALQVYYDYYGPDKPKPKYPILPPRPKPPPDPDEGKKKKKKGKKGKKGKKVKEPPPPFNMTVWRKEALPVASTKLWMPWFQPLPCFQPTPALTNPPSPPGEVPEPTSMFGWFINHMGPDNLKKKMQSGGSINPSASRRLVDRRSTISAAQPSTAALQSSDHSSSLIIPDTAGALVTGNRLAV